MVAIGGVAGLASGLLGVGGGIVIVPLLVFILGRSQRTAHITSLAVIVPVATVAVIPFALAGDVDYELAAALGSGALFGAPIGARMLARTSERVLKIAFGTLMILVSLQLVLPWG